MKIIESYCRQKKAYQDSFGKYVVLLENDEDPKQIIRELTKDNDYWRTYTLKEIVNEYDITTKEGIITYKGVILVFNLQMGYTD